MKKKSKKLVLVLACVVLVACLVGGIVFVVSGNTRYFEGEAEAYYQIGRASCRERVYWPV